MSAIVMTGDEGGEQDGVEGGDIDGVMIPDGVDDTESLPGVDEPCNVGSAMTGDGVWTGGLVEN